MQELCFYKGEMLSIFLILRFLFLFEIEENYEGRVATAWNMYGICMESLQNVNFVRCFGCRFYAMFGIIFMKF